MKDFADQAYLGRLSGEYAFLNRISDPSARTRTARRYWQKRLFPFLRETASGAAAEEPLALRQIKSRRLPFRGLDAPAEHGKQVRTATGERAAGPIRFYFIPLQPQGWHLNVPLIMGEPKGGNRRTRGFLDIDGSAWRWDPQKREWDVTLSIRGRHRWGQTPWSRDGNHLNVAPAGHITH